MTRPDPAPTATDPRRTLEALRQRLLGEQSGHLGGSSRVEHAHDALEQDGDELRRHEADRALDLSISDRDAVALAEVDAALQRLAQGRYGLCADCGATIPAARLQLAPAAARCVACASRREAAPGTTR